MRLKAGSFLIFLFSCSIAKAQVAINTTGANPDNSAMLDITSTTKGLLTPRMATAARMAIAAPATGLLVYDTDLSLFYYYNGASWMPVSTSNLGWAISGNSGTISGTHFIGTTDNQHLDIRTNNILRTRVRTTGQIEVYNTGQSVFMGEGAGINDDLNDRRNVAVGYLAMTANATGAGNVAVGAEAMKNNTTGNWNTATGELSLANNTTGRSNSAFGSWALQSNTTGTDNSAFGNNAMVANTTGIFNSAFGSEVLQANTTGENNAAFGCFALHDNTTANDNAAFGHSALFSNTTGSGNTAVGRSAMGNNTTGTNNTAVGKNALQINTTGLYNSAFGADALKNNTTGNYNVAVGSNCMYASYGDRNVGMGYTSLYNNTGSYNIGIGHRTLYNNAGNENVVVGYAAMYDNTSGANNVGIGSNASSANTTGNGNVGIGHYALNKNLTGNGNTALGYRANVTTGNLTNATAIGYNSQVSQSNSMVLGGTGADAVNVGVGTTAPLSTLDVIGAIGMKVKNNQVAGANNPDNTATTWIYKSGSGNITFPAAASCTNRTYIIVNKTGATANISSYNDLSGVAQTTLATATSLTVVSDGANWEQIR